MLRGDSILIWGILLHVSVVAQIALGAEHAASTPDYNIPPDCMVIEMDIIVPNDFLELRTAYAPNTWLGGIIPYEFAANVTANYQDAMRVAMDVWEARADVSFVPRNGEADYILIQSAGFNNSYVGKQGGGQIINIASWGSMVVMAHELAHAMGFWHEQSRADRDDYIQVNYGNIQSSQAHNFDIRVNGGDFGPYDFASAMHYDQCALSTCCPVFQSCDCDESCRTITVLPPYEEWQDKIGQRESLSLGDAQGMGFLYGFSGPDCNGNHVRDQVDIQEGYSEDCDLDGIPDECLNDCNANLVIDGDDISAGDSPDVNLNGIPDECEIARLFVSDIATGDDNGTSWANAMTSLQRALRTAERGGVATEIWIAAGVYTPERCMPARTDSFKLLSGVTLFGGFAGIENPEAFDLAHRDFASNATILSGDVAGDDSSGGSTAENSYHVVSALGVDSTAVLDGITIQAGNADGASPHDSGAGVRIVEGDPTLRHCTIRQSVAIETGAGLHCLGGNPDITQSTILANESDYCAGAYFGETSLARVTKSVFEDNTARGTAGLCSANGSHTYVAHCLFLDNYASNSTSAMANESGSHSVVTNCVFSGNLGGAIVNSESNPTITNCTFSENFSFFGGSVWNVNNSEPKIANSILWSSGFNEVYDSSGAATVVNCIVGGGWSGAGHDNSSLDPEFRDALGPDGEEGTADDDLRLTHTSPCIDAGTNGVDIDDLAAGTQSLPAQDLDAYPRILCGNVDIGAYELGVGDFNCDGSFDLTDFDGWPTCMNGPDSAYAGGCEAFDFQAEGDVDLVDFALLQRAFVE